MGNIIKHARCNQVRVHLEFEQPHLQISIKDNGCGFDKEQVNNITADKKNSGISNMISRAAMIEADLSIESAPGKGTLILLKYPAKKTAAATP